MRSPPHPVARRQAHRQKPASGGQRFPAVSGKRVREELSKTEYERGRHALEIPDDLLAEDYHYLDDPIEATSRLPKALDEVMALYAGKNWVNEPGTKWDWSISGFQLLVSIVERISDHLTIVVLSNTEGQNAYAITRALARAVLGLTPLPSPAAPTPVRVLADVATAAADRAQLNGTYLLKLDRVSPDLHDSFAQYRRTYRVFDENGRLMIQRLGDGPEQLLRQGDGSYAMRSAPRARVSFTMDGGHATALELGTQGEGFPLSGARVGAGDPLTFHQQLR